MTAAELPVDERHLVDRFAKAIEGHGRVAVAFSGGVDSSVVLALTVRILGPSNVVAVLGVSPSLAATERAGAHRVAALIGAELIEVETQEIADPRYVRNGPDRCYFCKHELYDRTTRDVLEARGIGLLVNGQTADDVIRTDRPGMRAAAELGVRSPLAQAGIGKAAVRTIARQLGLPVWDKPSSPCLASRIPRAVPVTVSRLREVEQAENALRELGIREFRVRHRDRVALVELGASEQTWAEPGGPRSELERRVTACGFQAVEFATTPLHRD